MESLEVWREANEDEIAIFTSRRPRPIPTVDPSIFDGI
jgi:hypothetical protein